MKENERTTVRHTKESGYVQLRIGHAEYRCSCRTSKAHQSRPWEQMAAQQGDQPTEHAAAAMKDAQLGKQPPLLVQLAVLTALPARTA